MCDTAERRYTLAETSNSPLSESHPSLTPRFSPELASKRAPDERDGHLHPGLVVGAGEGQRPPPGLPRLLPQQQLHLRSNHQGQQVGHGRDAHQAE